MRNAECKTRNVALLGHRTKQLHILCIYYFLSARIDLALHAIGPNMKDDLWLQLPFVNTTRPSFLFRGLCHRVYFWLYTGTFYGTSEVLE